VSLFDEIGVGLTISIVSLLKPFDYLHDISLADRIVDATNFLYSSIANLRGEWGGGESDCVTLEVIFSLRMDEGVRR
jgi:hypothetical protein